MTFRLRRILVSIPTLAFLAGCSGLPSGGSNALFTLPSEPPPPSAPPVSESYVIQRAPVTARPYAYAPAEPYAPAESYAPAEPYAPAELFEVAAAEDARREAEIRRLALAQLQQRAQAQRIERAVPTFGILAEPVDDGAGQAAREATARAEARAAAAEAEAAELAAELAQARQAVAQAEAAAELADSSAQRAVRERVAQLAAERESGRIARPRTDRANPAVAPRPILGRFATRPALPAGEAVPPAPRLAPPPREFAVRAAPISSAPARPVVERAPIPGLKPYILARSAVPSAKPRRASPERTFGIGTPSSLSSPVLASATPVDISIPRGPGDPSTRFFPTPGKPSTMGTDRDAQLDLASIDAVPYGVGAEVREVVEGDSATADWADAVSLIENGEVEALAIMEDSDLVLTLCSGRSILTTPPDLAAAATLTAPQIICGQNKPLELR